MRTRSRVSATSSSGSIRDSARVRVDTADVSTRGLLVREREDDGVETDDAVFLEGDVEVVAFDFLRALLEGDDRLELGHLAEGVGALVEAVPASHHFPVPDRRALRAVHADVGRCFGHHLDEEIDAVDLDGDVRHTSNYTTPGSVGSSRCASSYCFCALPRCRPSVASGPRSLATSPPSRARSSWIRRALASMRRPRRPSTITCRYAKMLFGDTGTTRRESA